MQKSRDDHVFRHGKRNVSGFSRYQRSDTQQMSHVGHLRPFARAGVYLACVIDSFRETRRERKCFMLFLGFHEPDSTYSGCGERTQFVQTTTQHGLPFIASHPSCTIKGNRDSAVTGSAQPTFQIALTARPARAIKAR